MSTKNTTIDAFHSPEDEEEDGPVPMFVDYGGGDTDGNTGLSKTCDNCGGQVTDDFYRVFSSNEGALYGCHDCMTATAIQKGGPAYGRDYLRERLGIEPDDRHKSGGIRDGQ